MAALLPTNRKQAVRRVAVMFVLALLGLVVVGRMFGNGEPADVAAPTVVDADTIEITMPERLPAGEDFVIDLDGVEPGSVVRVILDAGYGLRQLAKTPSDTSMTVEVPAYSGPASGLLFVSVVQGDKTATSTMEIEPGEAVDPIDVYLGPRTVIADTQHFVMLVAVPEDIWGNPVAEGTTVDFTTTRADQRVENQSYPTEDLLSWYEVYSGTVAGRSRIAAESGNAGAAERTFLEVADKPTSYAIEAVGSVLPADGNALITIRTDLLVDRFNNVMPDGTVVVLDASGATGTRRIHSQTIDGRGEFTLEVPDEPGLVTLVATASGVQSEELRLDFSTGVRSFEAEIELAPEVSIVHIGPVRSVRGSYVPEGTVATVVAADGTTATADLSLGIGDAYFPPETDMSRVTVDVLGTWIVVRAEP